MKKHKLSKEYRMSDEIDKNVCNSVNMNANGVISKNVRDNIYEHLGENIWSNVWDSVFLEVKRKIDEKA